MEKIGSSINVMKNYRRLVSTRLSLTAFVFVMNRNEDERECRTCLLLLLMFYINYEKNGERLCRLIIFVFYPSEWFEQMIISSKDVDHQDDDHHQ
jgi:hypothetical protein